MKFLKYISYLAAALLVLSACGRENGYEPDLGPNTDQEGQLSFAKFLLHLQDENVLEETRALSQPSDDFIIEIFREGAKYKEYTYSTAPEVVSLPVGNYSLRVRSHEMQDQEWNHPYYEGDQTFSINKGEITEIDQVVCTLADVRVTIYYSSSLLNHLTGDAKTTVVVGQKGTLDYAIDETRTGDFAPGTGENNTVAATFTGYLDGDLFSQTVTYENVQPGSHYKITFKYDNGVQTPSGNLSSSPLLVSAEVTTVSVDGNIDVQEEVLPDDTKPADPDPDPVDPPTEDGPKLTLSDGAVWDSPVSVSSLVGNPVIITADSDTGITEFKIAISSDNAFFQSAIEDLFPNGTIDLINPSESVAGNLDDLGLPYGNYVNGKTHVDCAITAFMGMLNNVTFNGKHNFRVTVSDASGTTVHALILTVSL